MNRTPNIIRLDRSHVKFISALSTSAFFNDPQAIHIIPDSAEREKILPHIFEFAVRFGLMYGEGYGASTRLEGYALWLRSEDAKISMAKFLRAGFIDLCRKAGLKVTWRLVYFVFHSIFLGDGHIPARHWRLFLTAVDPSQQGNGYGGALLAHKLNQIDDERLPCYCDTFNEKNVRLYQRFGFRLVHSGPVPRTPVNVWAMVRTNPS